MQLSLAPSLGALRGVFTRHERVDERDDPLARRRAGLEHGACGVHADASGGAERAHEVGDGAVREISGAHIGLVHHEEIGDLHDPGLQELERVAASGLDHDEGGLGQILDVDLRLPDARGLDEDDVVRRREHLDGRRDGLGEPARVTMGGEGAHEQALVIRVEAHARAIPEERASAACAGGIDGDHADREISTAELARDSGRQGALTDPRRSGEPDAMPVSAAEHAEKVGDALSLRGAGVLDQIEGRRDHHLPAGEHPGRDHVPVIHSRGTQPRGPARPALP